MNKHMTIPGDSYSDKHPLVDVLLPTYNQEKYISHAIQSVLMQECSFEYRLIIGEDCSPDSTYDVCKQFADANTNKILLLSNSSNLGLAGNYKALFNATTARYIAILEGDDYWLDKHKLQKQVDILESNPEVGMVHTNYVSLYENGEKKEGHLWENIDLLQGNVIGPTQYADININPLTTCFRAALVKDNVDFDFIKNNKLLTVDIFLWGEIGRRASVYYMDEITGVYRIHSESITGNPDISAIEIFNKTSYLMVNYLMEKYETPTEVKEAFRSQIKLELIYEFLLANQGDKAKSELQNVTVLVTLKDKIIYLSAKYRPLNFLPHLIALFYRVGSFVKQSLNRMIDLFKKH